MRAYQHFIRDILLFYTLAICCTEYNSLVYLTVVCNIQKLIETYAYSVIYIILIMDDHIMNIMNHLDWMMKRVEFETRGTRWMLALQMGEIEPLPRPKNTV